MEDLDDRCNQDELNKAINILACRKAPEMDGIASDITDAYKDNIYIIYMLCIYII